MTTPDRSVYEIVNDLMESLINNYVSFDTSDDLFKFKEEVRQALKSERQKREEMAKEIERLEDDLYYERISDRD